jgi:hypothetical protein
MDKTFILKTIAQTRDDKIVLRSEDFIVDSEIRKKQEYHFIFQQKKLLRRIERQTESEK